MLVTVVGQAFAAAGYQLEERPVQWAGGLFRFSRALEDGLRGIIEFQLLAYASTIWAEAGPSRFRVTLIRTDRPGAGLTVHPRAVRRTLSALVVEDFRVPILPASDHWWAFTDTQTLGRALAEAGHLVVGYGLPWLAGDLVPPSG